MTIFDKISAVGAQLYPTGRAFKMAISGIFSKLNFALAASEERFYVDAISTFDSLLPDNNNFTTLDADDWERRLGLPTNNAVPLATRKLAILRKLQAPGVNPAKLHYLNLEYQLQLAGFNVWVHENTANVSPAAAGYTVITHTFQYGQKQYGNLQFGTTYANKLVNYIDESKDLNFNLGGNYNNTFFIGGKNSGTYATVPLIRKNELRELILKLKATENVALLFITYTP